MKLPGIDKRGIRFHAKWTHEFIRDFGWKEYLRVVWRDAWIYRFKNWRCWFGHILGEAQWSYDPAEIGSWLRRLALLRTRFLRVLRASPVSPVLKGETR